VYVCVCVCLTFDCDVNVVHAVHAVLHMLTMSATRYNDARSKPNVCDWKSSWMRESCVLVLINISIISYFIVDSRLFDGIA
jgi:hypothetical protein